MSRLDPNSARSALLVTALLAAAFTTQAAADEPRLITVSPEGGATVYTTSEVAHSAPRNT